MKAGEPAGPPPKAGGAVLHVPVNVNPVDILAKRGYCPKQIAKGEVVPPRPPATDAGETEPATMRYLNTFFQAFAPRP